MLEALVWFGFNEDSDALDWTHERLAELDASVQGWINHARYADSWGLREHVFATHPISPRAM